MALWSRGRNRSRRTSYSFLSPRRLASEQLEERLALSAATVGDSFLVNDLTIRAQTAFDSAPAVVATDTNQIAVFEGKGPVDGSGVFAEITNPDGSVAVASFRVNSTVRGAQGSPVVDGTADGKFVVAWDGRGVGDKYGVFFQRFAADGTRLGGETLVNATVGGVQSAPAVAVAADGSFFVAWSGVGTGDVSGVFLRRFDSDGAAIGDEVLVNTTTADHQQAASAAFNSDGELIVAWQSRHQDGDGWGVFAQRFSSTGARLGSETQLSTTTASSQQAATLATDPTGGIVAAWQSRDQDGDGWGVVARHFNNDLSTTTGEVLLNDSTAGNQQNVAIAVAKDGQWLAAWSTGTPNGAGWEVAARSIEADGTMSASERVNRETGGANSGHQQSPNIAIADEVAQIVWSGAGAADHQGVYSQRYELGLADSEPPVPDPVQAADLVAFAKAIAGTGATYFGTAWCPACTAQKELFEDGSKYLPFVEVSNPDRTQNQIGIDNNITAYPTWVFADGTRLEGVQTLETLSARTGVAIPMSHLPYLAELPDETLLVGSPLHVSLDGYDANGGPLTYTVSSDNPDVAATILSGNRSARFNVAGFGDMVFELFEQRASRATDRMIELANVDFYKDIIFHRVINNFVIQGGDPTGTGSGGSTLGDYDDHFNADLQHNRTGLLSAANGNRDVGGNTTNDTNDTQYFVTEGAQRHLDFNHTIFGIMVEGEANREAISNTATTGGRPDVDVRMDGIDIFEDTENAVLMLKAADGATGFANIKVTITDQDGHTFDRQFRVDLAADTSNAAPFLDDIAPVSVPRNTVATVQLTATDVEGDAVFYSAVKVGTVDYSFTVSASGLVEVTPPVDFVGTVEIDVRVGRIAGSPNDSQRLEIEFT